MNNASADKERIMTELIEVQNDRHRIQTELIEVQNDRHKIQMEMAEIQKRQDHLESNLNAVKADRDQIRSQLDNVWAEKERIRKELDNFVHRKSWRMTKPLRETAWFSKKLLRRFGFTKNNARRFGMSIFLHLRALPLLSNIADAVKKAHPAMWAKVRDDLSDPQLAPAIPKKVTIDNYSFESEFSEDEQYFISMFQHEIKKRKTSVEREQ